MPCTENSPGDALPAAGGNDLPDLQQGRHACISHPGRSIPIPSLPIEERRGWLFIGECAASPGDRFVQQHAQALTMPSA
jgi:hypothetical protein